MVGERSMYHGTMAQWHSRVSWVSGWQEGDGLASPPTLLPTQTKLRPDLELSGLPRACVGDPLRLSPLRAATVLRAWARCNPRALCVGARHARHAACM